MTAPEEAGPAPRRERSDGAPLREVWERVNAVQRDRWREHVADALPERLLDADGPVEELPG